LPDAGIENFTTLALNHNPDTRVIVQPIWLRWDVYEPTTKRPKKVDHNACGASKFERLQCELDKGGVFALRFQGSGDESLRKREPGCFRDVRRLVSRRGQN
jgi:hypothetical protein